MATWHQERNPNALAALWQRTDKWKVIDDRYGFPASSISFDTREDAVNYQKRAGGVICPPVTEKNLCDSQ